MALLSMTPVANATVTIPHVAPTIQATSYFLDLHTCGIAMTTITIVNMSTIIMAITRGMVTLGRHGESMYKVPLALAFTNGF